MSIIRPLHESEFDALVDIMLNPAKWMAVAQNGSDYVHAKFSQNAVRAVFERDLHLTP